MDYRPTPFRAYFLDHPLSAAWHTFVYTVTTATHGSEDTLSFTLTGRRTAVGRRGTRRHHSGAECIRVYVCPCVYVCVWCVWCVYTSLIRLPVTDNHGTLIIIIIIIFISRLLERHKPIELATIKQQSSRKKL